MLTAFIPSLPPEGSTEVRQFQQGADYIVPTLEILYLLGDFQKTPFESTVTQPVSISPRGSDYLLIGRVHLNLRATQLWLQRELNR